MNTILQGLDEKIQERNGRIFTPDFYTIIKDREKFSISLRKTKRNK